MNDDFIASLQEALALSPGNIPLRLTLAEALFSARRWEESEKEFRNVLEQNGNNIQAKSGLAKIFFELHKYSTVIVILEELINVKENDVNLLMMLSRALLRNGEPGKAITFYKQAISLNPNLSDAELDQHLRQQAPSKENGSVES